MLSGIKSLVVLIAISSASVTSVTRTRLTRITRLSAISVKNTNTGIGGIGKIVKMSSSKRPLESPLSSSSSSSSSTVAKKGKAGDGAGVGIVPASTSNLPFVPENFNARRARCLTKSHSVVNSNNAKCVVLWMSRDQRVDDNHALYCKFFLDVSYSFSFDVCLIKISISSYVVCSAN